MATSSSLQSNETAVSADVSPGEGEKRSLVLVAGSGRSGTSLFTGILQRLGFYVPTPEVPADETNPRGFAESQWVVDFHNRLLKKARVKVSDARPAAWSRVADSTVDDAVAHDLRKWMQVQFKEADHLIIKDPRLSWFLPLWRRCAEELEVSPRFATVLRHPAAVIDSKQRSYGHWQGEVSRTAAWLNLTLFTERATRNTQRVFVRYEDLLDDWTREVARIGDLLELRVIKDAPAAAIVRVHEFVDRGLSRSRASWDDFEIPASLREQVDRTWDLVSQLVDAEHDEAALCEELDAARAAYIAVYQEAEAITQSSIGTAPRRGGMKLGVARRIPKRFRHKLPLAWRRAARRSLHRGGSSSR